MTKLGAHGLKKIATRNAVPRSRLYLCAIGSLALVLAGCGSGEATDSSTAEEEPTAPTATTTDGQTAAGSEFRLEETTEVTLAVNPGLVAYLPFFLAQERGYFEDNNLDVTFQEYSGSATAQLPSVARGDVEFSTAVSGPGLFNQFNEGFNVRIVAGITEATEGWLDPSTWVVDQGVWEESALKSPEDLEGLRVDAAVEGSPLHYLAYRTLEEAGLTKEDVEFSHRGGRATWQQLLQDDLVDVAAVPEPLATQFEEEGLGTKWLSYQDIMPGFQESFVVTSPQIMEERPEVVLAFLNAFLKASADIAATEGEWTEELVAIAADHTQLPTEVLEAMGGPVYAPPEGSVNMEELEEAQQAWLEIGLLEAEVDPTTMVEADIAAEAAPGGQ